MLLIYKMVDNTMEFMPRKGDWNWLPSFLQAGAVEKNKTNIQNSKRLNQCTTKDIKVLATYVKSTVILIDLQLFNATDEKAKEFLNRLLTKL